MKINSLIKKAITLRKRGLSLRQIHERLGIAKSTCYVWLKDVKLNKAAQQKILETSNQGRQKGWATNFQRRLKRRSKINEIAAKEIADITVDKNLAKLICSLLYWAEGAKRKTGIAFTNSDPEMIKLFLKFFRKSFDLTPSKFQASLHLHEYHDKLKQKMFWSKVTKIPLEKISIYLKAHTATNIHPGYPGCISIRYHDVKIYEEVEAVYKNFVRLHGGLVQW